MKWKKFLSTLKDVSEVIKMSHTEACFIEHKQKWNRNILIWAYCERLVIRKKGMKVHYFVLLTWFIVK